jgi:3-amino-5-hydroxybenzoate synthase
MDSQAARRTINSQYLNKHLAEIEGITPQSLDPRVTRNGNYCYLFTYNPGYFSGLSTAGFIKAFNAEGIPTQSSYPPIHALDVFQNGEYRKRLAPEHAREDHKFLKANFPVSELGYRNSIWIVHRALLGTEADTADIVDAVRKIQKNSKLLVE